MQNKLSDKLRKENGVQNAVKIITDFLNTNCDPK